MNISNNYYGRSVDIELLKTVQQPSKSEQRVHFSLTYDNKPRIVAGIEKTAQRYALTFTTLIGSVMFDPGFGSIFIGAVAQGYLVNYGALVDVFAVANTSVMDTLRRTTEELPLDEQLESADLIDFNLDFVAGTIMLSIKLTSRAGTSTEFIVPTSIARV